MMFQVRCDPAPLEELAKLWMQANSALRQQITGSTHQIDNRLQTDPEAESEARSDDWRILFNLPLAVAFRIEPDGKSVSVLHVWLVRKRGQ